MAKVLHDLRRARIGLMGHDLENMYDMQADPTAADLASGKPFFGDIGFHIKEGPHSISSYDWNRFMDYAISRGWTPTPPKK